MQACAPGKLILSGEHSVVYGKPGIAMAIDRYAYAEITPRIAKEITFNLLNLRYQKSHTLNALRRVKRRLSADYKKFLNGEYTIRDVLQAPIELSQFVLTNLLDHLNVSMQEGLQLQTESNIPIGCGMGSSAAMILSVIHAIAKYFRLDLKNEKYYSYGLEAENLQHGRSSGLDLRVSLQGGCIHYKDGIASQREIPTAPMYLVNTGKPESSTGDCVSHAGDYIPSLLEDFAAVTEALDQALTAQNYIDLLAAIRENHSLLSNIGVVPEPVQQFIQKLEQQNMAAKICGAGSVAGDNAGIVLIVSEQNPEAICQRFGYSCQSIKGETRGLRAI